MQSLELSVSQRHAPMTFTVNYSQLQSIALSYVFSHVVSLGHV